MENILEYLDDKNKKLVSFIELHVPVIFTFKEGDCYSCQMHKKEDRSNKSAEIFYKKPLEQGKFAHELLHMKAELMLGDNYVIYETALLNETLAKIFDYQFCADILNLTQHIAFAPDIIEMGYPNDKHFEYETVNSNIIYIYDDALKTKLKSSNVYDINRVKYYLQLLFIFMFYPDNKRFKRELNNLKKVDVPLYLKVNTLKNAFVNIDLEEDNKITYMNSTKNLSLM